MLVNGREIVRTVFQTPVSGGDGNDQPQQEKKYFLQVETCGADGSIRETLNLNGTDQLFIKAKLIDADTGMIDAGTQSIAFWLASGGGWVDLALKPYIGGAKTAILSAVQPQPSDSPPLSAVVGFGGQNVKETVTINLVGERYILEVT